MRSIVDTVKSLPLFHARSRNSKGLLHSFQIISRIKNVDSLTSWVSLLRKLEQRYLTLVSMIATVLTMDRALLIIGGYKNGYI